MARMVLLVDVIVFSVLLLVIIHARLALSLTSPRYLSPSVTGRTLRQSAELARGRAGRD